MPLVTLTLDSDLAAFDLGLAAHEELTRRGLVLTTRDGKQLSAEALAVVCKEIGKAGVQSLVEKELIK